MSFSNHLPSGTRSHNQKPGGEKFPVSQSTNVSMTSNRSEPSGKDKPSWNRSFANFVNDLYRVECDTWAFEVLSIIVSMTAMSAVVFALNCYDGKPAPEWPHSLSLNAFISGCMTIMGAALTVPVSNGLGQLKWLLARRRSISLSDLDNLDRASRGMWGSMCVIFGLTGGILGCLGAFTTIVIFAAAPFAQQGLSTAFGSIESIQNPTTVVSACGPENNVQDICSGTSISVSTKKGRTYIASSRRVPIGAAVCYSIVVPSLLRGGYYSAIYGTFNQSNAPASLVTCPTGNCTWAPFTTLSLCSECKDVQDSLNFTNTSTLATPWGRRASIPGGPYLDTSFDTFAIGPTNTNVSVINGKLTFDRIAKYNASAITFAVLESTDKTSVSAIECSISFCIQLIQAEYSAGVYNETVMEEFKESYLELAYEDEAKTTRSFSDRFVFDALISKSGTQYPSISVDVPQVVCLGDIFEIDPREEVTLTELGIEKIPEMVDNIALSVGRGIRTTCKNGTQVLGSSWNRVSLVRVNWYWLILPIFVEILGVIFFLWVSISNKLSKTNIWKSSLVAAMFHGPDLTVLDAANEVEGLFAMEQVAEKMKVQLDDCVTGSEIPSRLVSSRTRYDDSMAGSF